MMVQPEKEGMDVGGHLLSLELSILELADRLLGHHGDGRGIDAGDASSAGGGGGAKGGGEGGGTRNLGVLYRQTTRVLDRRAWFPVGMSQS